jgi:hypothetical protein
MRRAREIKLSDEERSTLRQWSLGEETTAKLSLRAKIVLLAAENRMNKDIASELGTAPKTVSLWRTRFAEQGLEGIIKDAPRVGGTRLEKRRLVVRRILQVTILEQPSDASRWSTRTLAKHLGCSPSMVQRVWKSNGVEPHKNGHGEDKRPTE